MLVGKNAVSKAKSTGVTTGWLRDKATSRRYNHVSGTNVKMSESMSPQPLA